MENYKIIEINNLEYAVYPFKYLCFKQNGREVFFLIEGKNIKAKDVKIGKIYIKIPSWVEMQDLYQASCLQNMMTKVYEADSDLYRDNKIKKLCFKIVDSEGSVTLMDGGVCNGLYPILAQFIIDKINEIMSIYYIGTGLSKDEEEKLSFDCFKYYSSIFKRGAGKNVKIPPTPIPVLLMSICKSFNCTPNVARKISKRDIDMATIAREQENICKHPSLIGLK